MCFQVLHHLRLLQLPDAAVDRHVHVLRLHPTRHQRRIQTAAEVRRQPRPQEQEQQTHPPRDEAHQGLSTRFGGWCNVEEL